MCWALPSCWSGLGYGAFLLHVPHTWIVVGALVIVGIGIMSAVTRTKTRIDPSNSRRLPRRRRNASRGIYKTGPLCRW